LLFIPRPPTSTPFPSTTLFRSDPRFIARHERSKHAAAVNEAMRALMSTMTMKDAIAHFTRHDVVAAPVNTIPQAARDSHPWERRSEEHTSELQSLRHLVCRLLL